ncbi:MAG: pyruvate ferredoxin oxidoreductase [Clostridia bacterium]|nr:pyruvate ferredoxin oxidoreductase [Clostridia bacterium]
MPKTVAAVGTDAVAEAMRQIDPEVVAVYPITPQTAIVEKFSEFVADGLVSTAMIHVESEHSSMSACVGAAAAGGRVMTATSSQGLALMWEELFIASGLRLPIVMVNVNRALSAPINIHCDHSDSMGARDSGWIQLFSENAQEAYDNTIQAVRIAEHLSVRLPVMVNMDGFIISHSLDRVEFLDDDQVKSFVGEYTPYYPLLNTDSPVSYGSFDGLYGYYYEAKRAQEKAMDNARAVIREVGQEYGALSGRHYGWWHEFGTEGADICAVVAGSAAGTIRAAVQRLEKRGIKIGLVKIRMFRPWPGRDLVGVLKKFKALAVFDRSLLLGGEMGGHLFNEIRASLYNVANKRPLLVNYIYGLGGRDLSDTLVEKTLEDLYRRVAAGEPGPEVSYLGLRE